MRIMLDDKALAEELHPLLEPLHKRAHELGYRLTGFTLEKLEQGGAHDFATCTSECGTRPDGSFGCWTHCP